MNKSRGRPFQPGNKFGRGRPKGSRNREKFPGQRILEEYGEHIMRKCVSQALQGDRSALKICADLMSPSRRERFLRLALPAIRTARDIGLATEKLNEEIRRGRLTLEEGRTVMNIIESQSKVVVVVEMGERLDKVETQLSDRNTK